ncbi:hypothetical protein BDZ97DRAFT_1768387 [Flammula alnicola]|nr:hypothetical protein BDZ97DRAFT_1768387 [Flammula alnicola]
MVTNDGIILPALGCTWDAGVHYDFALYAPCNLRLQRTLTLSFIIEFKEERLDGLSSIRMTAQPPSEFRSITFTQKNISRACRAIGRCGATQGHAGGGGLSPRSLSIHLLSTASASSAVHFRALVGVGVGVDERGSRKTRNVITRASPCGWHLRVLVVLDRMGSVEPRGVIQPASRSWLTWLVDECHLPVSLATCNVEWEMEDVGCTWVKGNGRWQVGGINRGERDSGRRKGRQRAAERQAVDAPNGPPFSCRLAIEEPESPAGFPGSRIRAGSYAVGGANKRDEGGWQFFYSSIYGEYLTILFYTNEIHIHLPKRASRLIPTIKYNFTSQFEVVRDVVDGEERTPWDRMTQGVDWGVLRRRSKRRRRIGVDFASQSSRSRNLPANTSTTLNIADGYLSSTISSLPRLSLPPQASKIICPSPRRGMWARSRRIWMEGEGNELLRGDPERGRPPRCDSSFGTPRLTLPTTDQQGDAEHGHDRLKASNNVASYRRRSKLCLGPHHHGLTRPTNPAATAHPGLGTANAPTYLLTPPPAYEFASALTDESSHTATHPFPRPKGETLLLGHDDTTTATRWEQQQQKRDRCCCSDTTTAARQQRQQHDRRSSDSKTIASGRNTSTGTAAAAAPMRRRRRRGGRSIISMTAAPGIRQRQWPGGSSGSNMTAAVAQYGDGDEVGGAPAARSLLLLRYGADNEVGGWQRRCDDTEENED